MLVSDFDGVIIDGIKEYWASSRQAYINLIANPSKPIPSPDIPESFQKLRPWVHHGWEMVLLTAESIRTSSQLNVSGWQAFSNNYQEECSKALEIWKWKPNELQEALDNARRKKISHDFDHWLKSHQPFPYIVQRLQKLKSENIELAVLTTKSVEFTQHLLNSCNLEPTLVFGHESGSKTKVLSELAKDRVIMGFIEDRRNTLEAVINDPELSYIPCFLASWGYLKPKDLTNLPLGIHLLDPTTLKKPLERWS